MSASEPTISVLIATYNCEKAIRRCLNSLVYQSYSVQIIVIDNCSSDSTQNIVREYLGQGVQLIVGLDAGVFDAWNKGIMQADGDWIVFVGSDDFYNDQEAFKKLAARLRRLKRTRVVYGLVQVISKNGEILQTENQSWDVVKHNLNHTLPFTHVGTAHHRSLFAKDNRFDPNFRIAGDYDFLYRELQRNGAEFEPTYTVNMQTGGLSRSIKNRSRLLAEVELIWCKNGVRVPVLMKLWVISKKIAFWFLAKFTPNLVF